MGAAPPLATQHMGASLPSRLGQITHMRRSDFQVPRSSLRAINLMRVKPLSLTNEPAIVQPV
jgi:hypothetical protein